MSTTILLIASILSWLGVAVGLFQRIFLMPKWFENPPESFERIRSQSKTAKIFWIPLSMLTIISYFVSLILNWKFSESRWDIIIAIICFGLIGMLSGIYFVKEVLAFSKIPVDATQTPELLKRTNFWLKWTTVRDVLQISTAIFITLAYKNL